MVWFIILAVITAGLALGLPPDPQTLHQLHISSLMYRVAILVLLVPYGIIWYAAFYAFAKLKEYSQAIKGSKDGTAFYNIMIGMGTLAFGLILPTTISLVMNNIVSHHSGFKPASVIIDNYLGLLVALIAFIYISNGTNLLTKLSKNRPSLTSVRVFALLFIALAAVFTYLVINYHVRHGQVYYLNTPLLITTFIIPALFAWFIAILSAYEFRLYAKFVKGLLYRAALRQFSQGIVIVISGSVAIQFVDNTFAAKVSHSLGALLAAEYALLAIYVVGLILMALGAKKLKKIEEA
jgi:hypothetical protein